LVNVGKREGSRVNTDSFDWAQVKFGILDQGMLCTKEVYLAGSWALCNCGFTATETNNERLALFPKTGRGKARLIEHSRWLNMLDEAGTHPFTTYRRTDDLELLGPLEREKEDRPRWADPPSKKSPPGQGWQQFARTESTSSN
jgi:hypothetical protein